MTEFGGDAKVIINVFCEAVGTVSHAFVDTIESEVRCEVGTEFAAAERVTPFSVQ